MPGVACQPASPSCPAACTCCRGAQGAVGWVAGSTGISFKCNPSKPPTATGQRCFSRVRGQLDGKTGFAVDAEGLLQVSRAVAASPVRLRLSSSGRARVTVNGVRVAALATPAGTQWEWGTCGLYCTALHCSL